MIRWLGRALLVLGGALVLLAACYGAALGYFAWREHASPSTVQVLALRDGRTVPLVQPVAAAMQPTPSAAKGATSAAPVSRTLRLPPTRISIARIGVDWPVVLSDNDHLPQFKGVGWMMGSGFPAAPGNMVLFGHLGGQNGTFMRLHELQPGDMFSVWTTAGEQRYRVRSLHETTPDDVGVLASTGTASATLITCSGPWDAAAQTNVRRLIVSADWVP